MPVVSGAPIFSTLATTNSPIGQYAITVAPGTLSSFNYAFTVTNSVLTVGQAMLTVSANNTSRAYGATNPVFAPSYSGFLNNDAPTVLSGAPTFSTTATTNSPVGQYPIMPAQGTLSAFNYTFNFANGTLTVGKATLTVSANSASRSYGATNPVFTPNYNGFLNGDTSSVLSGAATFSTTATANSPVGNYAITVGQGTLSAANYAFNVANGTLTVGPATLTVSADNKSRIYGATNPLFTVSYSGFMNNDAATVLSGAPVLSTTATTGSPVGPYGITVTQGTLSAFNYTFSFTSGVLTVGQATVIVSADNKSRTYGTTNPIFTASYSGFLNGDTTNVLSGAPALTTSATTNSPVGQYTITNAPGTLSATNYAFSFTNGVLTIGQATLGVSADAKSRIYGVTNPVFTASYTGFLNGDTTNVLSGAPALGTLATTNSPVGPYTITNALGTLSAGNYAFSFTNGVLTIGQATLTVTADNQSRPFGANNPQLTASYSGFANGETVGTSGVLGQPGLSTTATQASPTGNYAINITQGNLSAGNYAFNLVNGTLTVVTTPAPVIQSLTGAGTASVSIQWSAVSNVIYRVQYTSNLNTGAWVDITPDVTAAGNTASATDNPAGASLRFYRILIVP